MSGLTTTGATVLGGSPTSMIESLPRSLLLWRATTHWLGGLEPVATFDPAEQEDPIRIVRARHDARPLAAQQQGPGQSAGYRAELAGAQRYGPAGPCDADQILVFSEQGSIAERGTHEDLVRADGEYTRIARIQALEEEIEALE